MSMMLRARLTSATAQPVRSSAVRPAARPARTLVVRRAEPAKSPVEAAVKEAEAACKDGTSGECAAAWDTVEEVSAAMSHKKAVESDPMEKFCEGNEDADECRVYDN